MSITKIITTKDETTGDGSRLQNMGAEAQMTNIPVEAELDMVQTTYG